jgi:hypothetical protein
MGLNHMNGRIEDSVTGRFLSPDPGGTIPGSTQSWNRYSYVNNNPISYIDPSGFYGQPITVCVGSDNCGSAAAPGALDEITVNAPRLGDTDPNFGTTGGSALTGATGGGKGAGSGSGDGPLGTIVVTAQRIGPPPPPSLYDLPGITFTAQSQTPHKYVITANSNCSADNTFNQFMGPGMSAPGAPPAKEGFTPRINLPGLTSYNPISQSVNSYTRTIVNTTLPGHVFFPGQVTIQVDPAAGDTSAITITGTGTSSDPELNDAVGNLFFGFGADSVATSCSYSPI